MRLARRAAWLCAWPATAAHEATHWAVARWHAETDVTLGGERPEVLASWDDTAPWWAIVAAGLAPALVGTASAVTALGWIALRGGGPLPSSVEDWLLLSVMAAYWGIYTVPSAGDWATVRDGAAQGLDDSEINE